MDPLEAGEAVAISAALGLPERTSAREGTTIMIVAPILDEDSDVRNDLIETVLWNFWPRMCRSTTHQKRLTLRLEIDGEQVLVPDPEDFPPLDLFARALEGARRGDDAKAITSLRPKKHLGQLAIRKGARADRHVSAFRERSLIPKQAAHIALMRPVELIVKYIHGEPFSDGRYEWAGVFICSEEDEVEQAFADSEPPAHDDWVPQNLPKGDSKRFVNIALSRLSEEAKTYVNPIGAPGRDRERGPSLASTASMMGKLLETASATGPGRGGNVSRGGVRKRKSISAPRFVGLEMVEGVRTAIFEADLTNDQRDPKLCVIAEPYIVIDGGTAVAADASVAFDGQVTWIALGLLEGSSGTLEVGVNSGKVICHVPVPEDAAVGVKLSLKEGKDA